MRRVSIGSLVLVSLRGLAMLAASAAFVATSGCSSIPDLRFDDSDAGAVDPNCRKTSPEICDDGVDNDCNGRVDCEDSACTPAFSCQAAPEGWAAAAFAATSRPTCPSGETAADLKVVSGDGAPSCTCSCAAAAGSCATNTFTLSLTTESTCGVAPTVKSIPPDATSCTALPAPFSVPAAAFAKAAAVASCVATATPAGGALSNGRLCQAPRFGKGCSAAQVCAPTPAAGLGSCVVKAGTNACPAGFGKRSTAGATGTDGRTCLGCACGPPAPCSGGSVSLYDGSMCKTGGAALGATGITGSCAATTDSGFSATHFKSTPATGGACAGTPTTQATPGGALTFTEPRTICCP